MIEKEPPEGGFFLCTLRVNQPSAYSLCAEMRYIMSPELTPHLNR